MSAPKRYTEEVKAEAVRRYIEEGEDSPKIAADLGCSAHDVLNWVYKSFKTPERSVKNNGRK